MNNIYDISSTHNINDVKLLNIPFILSYIVLHDEFNSTAGDSNLPSVIRQIQKISTKVAKTLTSPGGGQTNSQSSVACTNGLRELVVFIFLD